MPLRQVQTLEQLRTMTISERTIGILPVAATEAHGPHLPPTTDCDIAEGHLSALAPHIASHIDAVALPIERIGASREHAHLPATQSLSVPALIERWMGILRDFHAAGGRRVVLVSSHGGNTPAVDTVILEARAELGMLAVGSAWLRFGYPEGLFSEAEIKYGIHGGDVETSLMLHYWPDRVAVGKAGDFPSALEKIEPGMAWLTGYGRHRFGWLSTDLNPLGVVGNAGAASAGKGALLSHHILTGFAGLLEDMTRFERVWGQ